jgi:hypothetical protein
LAITSAARTCRKRNRSQRAQTRDRISEAYSPIPAVNTRPSIPPIEVVNAPISRTTRNTNSSTASRARKSPLQAEYACRLKFQIRPGDRCGGRASPCGAGNVLRRRLLLQRQRGTIKKSLATRYLPNRAVAQDQGLQECEGVYQANIKCQCSFRHQASMDSRHKILFGVR